MEGGEVSGGRREGEQGERIRGRNEKKEGGRKEGDGGRGLGRICTVTMYHGL